MKVLVACEFSGRVRDAFRSVGHHAMSCDLLPTDVPGPHYQGPVQDVIGWDWDMMIGFPPCTDLSLSGARWWPDKRANGSQDAAVGFFMMLAQSRIPRIALENPVGIMSTLWRKPDQIIHPWQYGHGEKKRTCLWLKNLPPLVPTEIVPGRVPRVHMMWPSPTRWKERSATYPGIAQAMAMQWGALPE